MMQFDLFSLIFSCTEDIHFHSDFFFMGGLSGDIVFYLDGNFHVADKGRKKNGGHYESLWEAGETRGEKEPGPEQNREEEFRHAQGREGRNIILLT